MTHANGESHAYGVRLMMEWGRQYLPWCECGWEGDTSPSHDAAAEAAYTHATGRIPPVPIPRQPRGGRGREEVLFDGREYDR
jgi:hypothetical protein